VTRVASQALLLTGEEQEQRETTALLPTLTWSAESSSGSLSCFQKSQTPLRGPPCGVGTADPFAATVGLSAALSRANCRRVPPCSRAHCGGPRCQSQRQGLPSRALALRPQPINTPECTFLCL